MFKLWCCFYFQLLTIWIIILPRRNSQSNNIFGLTHLHAARIHCWSVLRSSARAHKPLFCKRPSIHTFSVEHWCKKQQQTFMAMPNVLMFTQSFKCKWNKILARGDFRIFWSCYFSFSYSIFFLPFTFVCLFTAIYFIPRIHFVHPSFACSSCHIFRPWESGHIRKLLKIICR